MFTEVLQMSVLKLGAIALILSFCVSRGFAGNISIPLCVTDNSGGGAASNWVIVGPTGGDCFQAAQTVAGDPRLPVTFVLPQNRANGEPTAVNLNVQAKDVYLDYPQNLKTVSNANITLGTRGTRYVLGGQVDITEGSYTAQINLDLA